MEPVLRVFKSASINTSREYLPLKISMMEHELMSSEDGVTFEDVMSLCNVHANLFKGAIADVKWRTLIKRATLSMCLNKRI